MIWLLLLAVALLGISVVRGAPWLPSRQTQIETALDLLDLEEGQTVIDLGSGAGGFLLAAEKRGLRAVGYEINPLLWLISRIRTWPHRPHIRVHCRDFWGVDLGGADGIYVFLIARLMPALGKKLRSEAGPDLRVVSYVFSLPEQEAVKEQQGLKLYEIQPPQTDK